MINYIKVKKKERKNTITRLVPAYDFNSPKRIYLSTVYIFIHFVIMQDVDLSLHDERFPLHWTCSFIELAFLDSRCLRTIHRAN